MVYNFRDCETHGRVILARATGSYLHFSYALNGRLDRYSKSKLSRAFLFGAMDKIAG
jgi:hypothetical protein